MKYLINEVIDIHGQSYKLFLELNDSKTKDYVDIRFFSTFSGAKDPNAEQTKWKTTLPIESILDLSDSVVSFLTN